MLETIQVATCPCCGQAAQLIAHPEGGPSYRHFPAPEDPPVQA